MRTAFWLAMSENGAGVGVVVGWSVGIRRRFFLSVFLAWSSGLIQSLMFSFDSFVATGLSLHFSLSSLFVSSSPLTTLHDVSPPPSVAEKSFRADVCFSVSAVSPR